MAYIHDPNAHDWEVYQRATYDVCSGNLNCNVVWFDGISPKTEEEIEKWVDHESHLFVEVADLHIDDEGELHGNVDCERIDAPAAQKIAQ